MVVIQVALDFVNKYDAFKVAEEVARENVWIEAGTPLIKSQGVAILRELKDRYPNQVIVADMKTFDAGSVEAGLAFSNGADVTTVMGLADDATIEDVVKKAKEYKKRVMVDMMGVQDPLKRGEKVFDIGADILCLHVGVDVQRKLGVNPNILASYVREIKGTLGAQVAVAGGITDETAKIYHRANADIIIVGKYIIHSENPAKALEKLIRSLG